jgi:hypothetical protein
MIPRSFLRIAFALALAFGAGGLPAAHAASASADLATLDKTLYSGLVEASVDRYPAPAKNGKRGAPERYPAELLFERPDRLRLRLRPGAWNAFVAVAEAGTVRWQDKATGLSGKDSTDAALDPLAVWLLGTAGELFRFGKAFDLPPGAPKSGLYGARLAPDTYGTSVADAIVWFANGHPTGLDVRFTDGTSLFVSILRFDRNVKTSPGDFDL